MKFDEKYELSAAFVERFRVWTVLFERYIDGSDLVMDLGCGSGVFSNYLAAKGCSVTGIDGSVKMINLCNQKKTTDSVHYVVQTLPLPDNDVYEQQDVIIASSLLEYIEDIDTLLSQAKAMLKPNGLLIVSMPNRLSMYRCLECKLFALTGYPRYFAHIHHTTTKKKFNQKLYSIGFNVLETTYFSSYDPLSRLLKWVLPKRYVNNLFVGVYRKR